MQGVIGIEMHSCVCHVSPTWRRGVGYSQCPTFSPHCCPGPLVLRAAVQYCCTHSVRSAIVARVTTVFTSHCGVIANVKSVLSRWQLVHCAVYQD